MDPYGAPGTRSRKAVHMGIFDNIGEQVAQHGEAIDQAIEKGAEFIDEKTGGKHSDQISQAADFVKDKVDDLAHKKEGE